MRLVLFIAAGAIAAGASDCDFVVAPPATSLFDARDFILADAARSDPARSHTALPLTVCLAAGVHDVSRTTLEFDGYSGRRVVWRGLDGPGSAIVSGGAQVSGWAPTTLGGGAAFVAPVPAGTFPAGAAVRQLWVAGARSSRVIVSGVDTLLGGLTPWQAADNTAAGFVAGGAVPPEWLLNGTACIEFAWPVTVANWIEPRCTVASIIGRNITLASPCGGFLINRNVYNSQLPPPVTAEAAPAFPLQPGVFYHSLEQSALYYALAPGQSLADLQADAWVAPQEVLVSYTNSGLHDWVGVAFQYGTWGQPNSGDGFVDEQSAVYACSPGAPNCNVNAAAAAAAAGASTRRGSAALVPTSAAAAGPPQGTGEPRGNVRVSRGRSVSFINCTFSHLGGPYALSVMESSQNVTVAGCAFSDLSGGFLKLGSVQLQDGNSSESDNWDAWLSVTDNTASDMALEYSGAAGFFGGFLWESDISHNTVSDAGYSGFSLGWGWGTVFPEGYGGNSITYNRIFNVMRLLRDGGGIYVNGASNGTYPSLMAHNWVDHDQAVYAVFYLDNGASHWLVTDNVASNSSLAWAAFMTGGGNLPAKNNRLQNFWWGGDLAPVNNCAAYNCTLDAATVVQVMGDVWPPAATAIMAQAGARY